jgi:hypothetical protein
MEKYKLDEGLESLNRVKLLMSYKNDMTLTENEEKIKGLLNEGHPEDVEKILDACTTEVLKTKTFTDEEIKIIARTFYDAFSRATLGIPTGTDLDKVKEGLDKLSVGTFGDLCAVNAFFETRYGQGDNFFTWIDDDIDYDDEWINFVDVFSNLKDKYDNSPQQTNNPPQQTNNNNFELFKTFVKNDWANDFKGNEVFGIEGDLYYVIDENKARFNYKLEGNKFIFVQ